jgi:hypothetical protein
LPIVFCGQILGKHKSNQKFWASYFHRYGFVLILTNKSRHLLCGWAKLVHGICKFVPLAISRARKREKKSLSFVEDCIVFINMKILFCFVEQASLLAARACDLGGICECT